ncbi:MAG: KH domain-containing protein [Deltaproteobacteria bacterium]|nr:MAG: KH domain-containing protein [Deltaproteobacteria bacterium]
MERPVNEYIDLLQTLMAPLLGTPEALEISPVEREGALALNVRVHPDDTGRVIGKGGAGIDSLRRLVEFAARRAGDVVSIDLQDG